MATEKITITLQPAERRALRQTGGRLTKDERSWADALLGSPEKKEGQREEAGRLSGITFDAGGLIALDRNDRRVILLLARATELGMRVTVNGRGRLW
jgi:hypothetical protein